MAEQPPVVHSETVGRRLRRLRVERGLSQRELAAPGVSYAYISRIEAGTRQPSVKALRRLGEKLGVSATYLETGSELEPAAERELRLADLELALRLGEPADVQEPLEQVLAQSLTAGDRESALRARVALALVARQRGDFASMISLLEEAVEGEPFAPAERLGLYAELGYAYSASGRPDAAVDLYERCLAAVRELGNAAAVETRYSTLLSYTLSDMGELARAEQVVQETLAAVGEGDDPYMRVRLFWSLARLAHAEDQPALALGNARKAIALLETTEDTQNLARAHLMAASINVTRGDPGAAESHLELAGRLLGSAPSFHDEVMLRVKRAQAAALRGDGEETVALARGALDLIGGELPPERGAALWALAEGLTLQGDRAAADAAYGEAVELLEQHRRRREAMLACRAWARMLRAAGREQDALDVLDRAAELGLTAAPSEAPART